MQGGKYHEAPALAEQVTAGTLSFAINRDEIGKFPFTGGVKFDPRNSPIQTLTLGPLYYRWLTSNGKRGTDRAAEAGYAIDRHGTCGGI